MLGSLRNSRSSVTVDAHMAAEVVAHLTVRGAFIRDFFASGFQEMLVTIGSLFSSEESSRSILGIDYVEPADMVLDAINSAYAELPKVVSKQLPRPLFMRLASAHLRENFQDFHNTFAPQLELIMTKLQHELPTLARRGHAKALEQRMAPDKRVAVLSSLTWTVRPYDRHSLILPDCVALSEFTDGSLGPLHIQENEKLASVLVPLSDHCLLIGQQADASRFDISAQEFNRSASASCWEFFIASHKSEELTTFATEIGHRPREFLSATIDDVRKDFPVFLDEQLAETSEIRAQAEEKDAPNRTLSVHFLGCADQEKAQRVAGIVASIVQEVGKHFPLNRLDTITFALDYAAVLRDLDTGFPQLKTLAPTEDSCGIGVAMAPLVLRDGQMCVCVIARSWLSDALLNESQSARSTAIHTLVGMMARVAFVEYLDTSLPGTLLKPLPDAWNAFLFQQIEGVCSAYFSARVAAPYAPEIGDGYRTLFCNVLARADIEVPKERLAYRTQGKLDEFLGKVAEMVRPVLVHCATLIGHFDGLEESPFDEEGSFSSALQAAGLGAWFDVYGRDLRRNHDRIGAWSSLEEFMFLTVHVERHLWRYGIFPWRSEEGTVRVEVPLITDAEALALF